MSPRHIEQTENLREVMRSIHLIMVESFGVRKIKIVPIGQEGSRLSIPIKITGVDSNCEPVRYFAKIIGSSDMMTEKTIQLFKNLYLQMADREPLFGFTHSAKAMAQHQFNTMKLIEGLGIPTAKPLGTFALPGGLWLFVAEYLEFAKLASMMMVSDEQVNEAFDHLRLMHKNGIFHGDIKPDNFLFYDKVYILDVGNFLDDAPDKEKIAYDIACTIASFVNRAEPEKVVDIAMKHYSKRDLRKATSYFELINMRPDFQLNEELTVRLVVLLG